MAPSTLKVGDILTSCPSVGFDIIIPRVCVLFVFKQCTYSSDLVYKICVELQNLYLICLPCDGIVYLYPNTLHAEASSLAV